MWTRTWGLRRVTGMYIVHARSFFALYALYPANVVISYIASYCVLRRCLSLDDLNVITVHDRKCLAAFRSMRID